MSDDHDDNDDAGDDKKAKPKRSRAARIGQLRSSASVAVEMARIYRKCRLVEMDIDTGVKLVRILAELRAALDQSEFEKRVAGLEAVASGKGVVPFRRIG